MNKERVSKAGVNKERWQALMRTMGFEPALDSYQSLYDAYSEKHRFYHTVKHIDAMLGHLDNTLDLADKPAELELAIWFHDAIYKPFSKTNEADSAHWAEQFLSSQGCDQARITRVSDLIMATLHQGKVNSRDEKLIVDIDLTILGTPSAVYDAFEHQVREEYKRVPLFIYRRKRKEVLQSFLNQDSIYNLSYFRDRYENTARENLNRAINNL